MGSTLECQPVRAWTSSVDSELLRPVCSAMAASWNQLEILMDC